MIIGITAASLLAVVCFGCPDQRCYVDRREVKCACVGGDSEVPPGSVSLTENMMVAMAVWMAGSPMRGAMA